MKVESILKSKGSKVMTTRPTAKIATVIHKMRLEKVGALGISGDTITYGNFGISGTRISGTQYLTDAELSIVSPDRAGN